MAIPIWITEIASPKGRAMLSCMHPTLILLGNSLPMWIGLASSINGNDYSTWRTSIGVGCVWPFMCLLFCCYLPESPRWLLRNGKTNDAWRLLASVRPRAIEVHESAPRLEFEQMIRHINAEVPLGNRYARLYRQRSCTKRLFIACAMNFFVLSSGISIITGLFPRPLLCRLP